LIAGLNGFRANYEGGDGNNLTLELVDRANVPENGMTFSLLTLAFAGLGTRAQEHWWVRLNELQNS
jgi:hypothetical protein